MKMYDYLVAYDFSADGYLTACSGTMQVSLKKKIRTFEDIRNLNSFIEDNIKGSVKGATNVNVYNFILLGRNRK